MDWISVEDKLPKMYSNVIIFGRIPKLNILKQLWEARRWTGCSTGFDVERDKLWEWYTPTGMRIEDVTHWMLLPDMGPTIPRGEPGIREEKLDIVISTLSALLKVLSRIEIRLVERLR